MKTEAFDITPTQALGFVVTCGVLSGRQAWSRGGIAMTKWIMLAVGVLLSANGFYTRTYDFPNDTRSAVASTWMLSGSTDVSITSWRPC